MEKFEKKKNESVLYCVFTQGVISYMSEKLQKTFILEDKT